MIDKQEQLKSEYLANKRQYEEKEDELILQKNKSLKSLDELAEFTHYQLRDFADDQEFIQQGLHKLSYMQDEVNDSFQRKRAYLNQKIEDIEINYMRELKQMINEEQTRREEF